ncbi:phosphocholine cytidylyltransferase family protein [Flavisphingomonas formosensis]|uniref:phosphocholine cytidylyltransferase family protein n=1 Tax=Flavisphingomonas formosensis TaxID=861534 RepID=UPI0012FBD4FD|nr:phosphocholine cytidylyltransferase family protein [Sphingomonas formosensis]
MMLRHAIILSAGQGSRLLPLTQDKPKCLIDFSGRSLIEWQIRALAANGIDRVTVVTGFQSEMVEAALADIGLPNVVIRTLFNPFYKVADNLGSCWIARDAMEGDFLILNGDTLVSPQIVATLLGGASTPISVTVDVKPAYDADDMKVQREGSRLLAIGKRLAPEASNAESIGILAFRGLGPSLFRNQVETMMRTPEGTHNWYLKAIDALAPTGIVGTVSIEGLDWAEVDFPQDVAIASALAGRWAAAEPLRRSA